MNFQPYKSLGSIRFGMMPKEVEAVLGTPLNVGTNYIGEREEGRKDIVLRYDSVGLAEIAVEPEVDIFLSNINLWKEQDLLDKLLSKDTPYETLGFLVFLKLGIALTGFHDDDEGQKAITLFRKGRWDQFRDSFAEFKR